MNASANVGLFAALRRFTANLRYPHLFALFATLFVVDLVIPDPVPFVDEILLGLLTLLMARLKDGRGEKGEVPPLKDVTPGRS